jgi:sugar/nucleoside kinase (ribokinase family)
MNRKSNEGPRSESTFRIFGLGTVVVDHQVMLDRLPEADHKGEIVDDRRQVGGPVPTALCVLRRLGHDTTFQGSWAADGDGDRIEADLRREGVHFHAASKRMEGRTGFAHVWVERGTGRRSIAGYRGSHPIEEHEVRAELLAGHDALHLDGWSAAAAIKAARIVRARGGVVFLDLGSPKPDLSKLLAEVDFVNCPSSLFQRLYGSADMEHGARELLEHGPRQVTVTDGAKGAWLFRNGHPGIHQAAFPIDAIDTNGAGDTFSGAMIHGTLKGWPAEHRLRFAAAAAAVKCAGIGNRAALPTLVEIDALIRTGR